MSLQARPVYVMPESTAQVARSIFPNASPVMRMLDELHMISPTCTQRMANPLRRQ